VHARYQKDRLDLRALYARGHLSDADDVNIAFANAIDKSVGEEFYGWYTEAAYQVWRSGDQSVTPFVRYEKWDMNDEVPTGYVKNSAWKNHVWTVGANYNPHPQVVLKADYQEFDKPDGASGDKRLNMGMGYMF
jgi:outer membrane receptor protein involved in Fe transport